MHGPNEKSEQMMINNESTKNEPPPYTGQHQETLGSSNAFSGKIFTFESAVAKTHKCLARMKAASFLLFMLHVGVCCVVVSDPCSLVATCWERAVASAVASCHFPKCVLVHI